MLWGSVLSLPGCSEAQKEKAHVTGDFGARIRLGLERHKWTGNRWRSHQTAKQCHQIRQQWGPFGRRIVWYPRKNNQHSCQLSSVDVGKRTHMKKQRNNRGIKERSKDCGWNARDPRSSQQPAVSATVRAAPVCDDVLLSVGLNHSLSSLRLLPGPAHTEIHRDTQK